MKWITHQAGALALALLFRAEPAVCAGMLGGAVLPDLVEQTITRGNKKLFLRIHRESLHWFGWYAGLLVAALAAPLAPRERALAVGVMLGALSHVAMDALNPSGVPLSPLGGSPRLRFPLVSTGSLREYVLLAALLGLIVLAGYNLDPSWMRRLARFFG